jgi:hypothetical protein
MRILPKLIRVCALTIMILTTSQVLGQDAPLEPVGEFGSIDWMAQKVIASGIGVAPANAPNSMQAKTLAHRAAVVVAQRNLLEVVKGVHIDSTTVVENFMAVDEKAVTQVKGILTNAVVENSRVLEDNAVEVTMSVPLRGELTAALFQMASGVTATESRPEPAPAYTGLLIDARATGFQPCLRPTIMGPQTVLYPGPNVDQSEAEQNGYVGYFRNMEDALKSERAGACPYSTKALGTGDGHCSLVVSSEASDLLRTIRANPSNFLSVCRVAIVY